MKVTYIEVAFEKIEPAWAEIREDILPAEGRLLLLLLLVIVDH